MPAGGINAPRPIVRTVPCVSETSAPIALHHRGRGGAGGSSGNAPLPHLAVSLSGAVEILSRAYYILFPFNFLQGGDFGSETRSSAADQGGDSLTTQPRYPTPHLAVSLSGAVKILSRAYYILFPFNSLQGGDFRIGNAELRSGPGGGDSLATQHSPCFSILQIITCKCPVINNL